MTTRRDVAQAAQVSVRTVSNVVTGFTHVAPETRRRVLEAIERLDYRPSEMARSLKVGRSGLVGLMLPELDTPYFAELTRAFVEEGHARGFTVVIDQTDGDVERERTLVTRVARGGLFDALILSPITLSLADSQVLADGAPVVFLGEVPFPGFDRVVIDNLAAARDAVNHLLETGHSRIAAIGWSPDDPGTRALRALGYQEALSSAGLPVETDLMPLTAEFRRADGAEAMRRLLDLPEPPDSVFCFSDPLALGALRALHEAGLRSPQDVAVVGFDDIEDGRYSCPTLTSISPDKRWIATCALDRISRRLGGENLKPETLMGPHSLMVRESSGSG